ncbi:hypothetical protein ILYODFUR_010889 [Ilyodon furcidens]|uniref:Uncharacterized protein n=1 Tax=Ilyodon furcidens TaxID=33524 RepID=A0ABV0V233_9TELE
MSTQKNNRQTKPFKIHCQVTAANSIILVLSCLQPEYIQISSGCDGKRNLDLSYQHKYNCGVWQHELLELPGDFEKKSGEFYQNQFLIWMIRRSAQGNTGRRHIAARQRFCQCSSNDFGI